MTISLQAIAIAVSVALVAVVLELVRRRRLVEEYAIVWLIGSLAVLALSVWRQMLDRAARAVGVYYPPSLLLLGSIGAALAALLWFSVVLSRQRRQIERLIEEAALLAAEMRDLQDTRADAPYDRSAGGRDAAASASGPNRPRV
jgi:hypothetical protein